MVYRSNPCEIKRPSIFYYLEDSTLALEEQFILLTTIPNNHKCEWSGTVTVLRFEQRFSNCSKEYMLTFLPPSHHLNFWIQTILKILLLYLKYMESYKLISLLWVGKGGGWAVRGGC